MYATAAHPVETAVKSTEKDTVRKQDMKGQANGDVYPAPIPPSENIQAPSLTREPDAFEASVPEWDPSCDAWIYRVSPKGIMSSRSEYRIDQSQISFLEGPSFSGGRADIVPANILNSQGVVLAVKKFRSADDDRIIAEFVNELGLQAELNHENIIKLVGFVEDRSGRIAWLVFPWMANGNLQEFLASGNWEIPERISLLYDVACGVEYLHSRNPPICHGDLRSLNILVNAENRGLIIDFGSARSLGMAPPRSTNHVMPPSPDDDGRLALGELSIADIEDSLQSSGSTALPTTTTAITLPRPYWPLRWAAPELVLGDLPALNSDIWSFGWLCWVIITDRLPFDDIDESSAVEIITSIMQRNVPSLSQVPSFSSIPRLRSLMEDCWQLEPENRPSATSCKDIISWMPRVIPTQRGDTKPSPHLLRVTGDMYLSGSRISDGLKYITNALEIARANDDRVEIALSLLSLGRAHYIRCEYTKATEAFEEAEALHARRGHLQGVARAYCGLAQVYCVLGYYDDARSSLLKANDIFTGIRYDVSMADIIYGLAELHKRRGKLSKAETSYNKAKTIYIRVGNHLGVADTTCGLADIQRMRHWFDLAEPAYLSAASLYEQLDNCLGISRTKCGLGDIYLRKGVQRKAEKLYQEAQDIDREAGHPLGLANALIGLGHAHCLQHRYSEAASCFESAKVAHFRIGNTLGVAETICGMGDIHRMRAEYSRAGEAYREARDLFHQMDHRLGGADAACRLGHLHLVQGRYSEAKSWFDGAEKVYKEEEHNIGIANAAFGLAAVYLTRSEHGKAIPRLRTALRYYTEAGIPCLRASALSMLALIYEIKHQNDEAMECIEEAISIYCAISDENGISTCHKLRQRVRDSVATVA
ncbi:hypothetical protein M407DRAFT_27679 [Tulasnella calospora MUT 4182]|uniref:Protein kinase domain-containing protein n=1 Tax=Tulasnella calospora MUT 4182 TaxID=1051891 RepID=A0A0C3QDG1_9AGAM|nr:hypothetical protein M407DRAFT_27679 [Tulasnella calospora MUT 4182]